MPKEVILAENSGFCFGVKRAAEIVTKYYNDDSTKVRTLGPLIHNSDVIKKLEDHKIHAITEDDLTHLDQNDVVVIRSHGVIPEIIDKIRQTGATVSDATCPYVKTIHRKVQKYYKLGYQVIIVGDENHPEVIGINGWCDNTAIITRNNRQSIELEPDQKVCIVAQTTERLVNFEKVVAIATKQSRNVLAFNTICSATKQRQDSTAAVAKTVDLMIVIGGKHSSNTKKLAEISRANCKQTIFIENSSQLPTEAILDKQVVRIGITAGASTPDWAIVDVIDKIHTLSSC